MDLKSLTVVFISADETRACCFDTAVFRIWIDRQEDTRLGTRACSWPCFTLLIFCFLQHRGLHGRVFTRVVCYLFLPYVNTVGHPGVSLTVYRSVDFSY